MRERYTRAVLFRACVFRCSLHRVVLIAIRRETRAAARLARLLMHLLLGLWFVLMLFPRYDPARRRQIQQWWAGKVLEIVGVRLATAELALPAPALIVSNHVSWLDIFVINAATQTHFVCKEEVKHWPVVGTLVRRSDTVFIERGSRAAAARTAKTMVDLLRTGERVTVFPEGTTSDGSVLLPFKAALFQSAVTAGVSVAPVALRYEDRHGNLSKAAAYDGDISLWQCLRNIVKADSLQVKLTALAPRQGLDRKQFADSTQQSIALALGYASDERRSASTECGFAEP